MVAKEISFIEFLENNRKKKLLIPIYQRAYEWRIGKDKEVAKLLEDIDNIVIDDKNSSHFLNSIVYIEDIKSKNFINIIDGQQRITTISILFIALRDRLLILLKEKNKELNKDKDNEELKDIIEDIEIEIEKISDDYLEIKGKKSDNKIRLSLSNKNKDREIYNTLFNNNYDKSLKSNILSTYKFFFHTQKMKTYLFNDIKLLLQKIEKISIVKVELDLEKDNPQRVFSGLNGGGLKLKDTDLIKNSIFMSIDIDKQEELHSELWEKLEDMPNEKNSDKAFANFIQHFLTMKLERVVTTNSIYDEFVNKYLKENDIEDEYEKIKEILTEMLEYKNIFLDLKNNKLYPNDSILPYFEIEAYYPFLMKLKYNDSPIFTKIIKIIESFYIRREVYGLSHGITKNIFASACKDVSIDEHILNNFKAFLKSKDNKQRFPTDEEFKDVLLTKNLYEDSKTKTRAILYILEKSINKDLEIDFGEISVEHILPQGTDAKYNNLLDCWKGNISNFEYDKQLHTLGNLTLLIDSDNSSIKDACFENKKEVYVESNFQLNEYLLDIDEWNSESIKSHGNYLVSLALDRWKGLDDILK